MQDHFVILDITNKDVGNDHTKSFATYNEDVFSEYSVVHPRYSGRAPAKRRRRNPATGQLELPQDDGDAAEDETAEPAPTAPQRPGNIKPKDAHVDSEMQIMDLEGENPIVSYQGAYYSCTWSTSIGTDMIFMGNDDSSAMDLKPKVPLGSWDLLDFGSSRLAGKQVHINRRTDKLVPQPEEGVLEGTGISRVAGEPTFWQKFTQLRIKKGELDGSIFEKVAPRAPAADWGAPSTEAQPPQRGTRGRPRGRRGGRPRGRAARSIFNRPPTQDQDDTDSSVSVRGRSSKRRRT